MPQKLWSSRVFPSRCRHCHSLVAATSTVTQFFVESAFDHLLIFGAALVSLFVWSWWPLIIALVVDVTVLPVIFHWSTPLVAFTAEDVFRTRQTTIVVLLVLVLLVVL